MKNTLRRDRSPTQNVHLPKEVMKMLKQFSAMMKDEKGQALAEYGLILALIAVICVGALGILGGNVNTTLGAIGAAL
jgi:pilus assembly protein Flp/PilA